jgi:hypothetical protein
MYHRPVKLRSASRHSSSRDTGRRRAGPGRAPVQVNDVQHVPRRQPPAAIRREGLPGAHPPGRLRSSSTSPRSTSTSAPSRSRARSSMPIPTPTPCRKGGPESEFLRPTRSVMESEFWHPSGFDPFVVSHRRGGEDRDGLVAGHPEDTVPNARRGPPTTSATRSGAGRSGSRARRRRRGPESRRSRSRSAPAGSRRARRRPPRRRPILGT